MPVIQQNYSLKKYNSFGIEARARYFAEAYSVEDVMTIKKSFDDQALPILLLGGGSNILFTGDFPGIVIKNNLKGISLVRETADEAWVKAESGEIWHELVLYCIKNNYGGIENLSLIPGTAGAAPIQNIGAYGVELKDVFDTLEALDLNDLSVKSFTRADCRFGYRDSIFKQEAKGRYFIVSITLKLQKNPKINTSYGAIQKMLDERGISRPTIADVSQVVCDIRNSKLPNPAVTGNAGSFFKNPEVPEPQYLALKNTWPEIQGYPTQNGIKLSAAWLIERCGWKGKQVGGTGTHKDHALVLVNYGHATGEEVKALALQIQVSVQDKFGVRIEMEVNLF